MDTLYTIRCIKEGTIYNWNEDKFGDYKTYYSTFDTEFKAIDCIKTNDLHEVEIVKIYIQL